MGKGDKKSRRGKIAIGSFGVRRPRRIRKEVLAPVPEPKAKPKKAPQPKPHTAVEEPAIVEETVVIREAAADKVVQTEMSLDIEPAKVPAKKPTKKTAEKAARPEDGEAKPKPVKAKKKTASTEEGNEKPSE